MNIKYLFLTLFIGFANFSYSCNENFYPNTPYMELLVTLRDMGHSNEDILNLGLDLSFEVKNLLFETGEEAVKFQHQYLSQEPEFLSKFLTPQFSHFAELSYKNQKTMERLIFKQRKTLSETREFYIPDQKKSEFFIIIDNERKVEHDIDIILKKSSDDLSFIEYNSSELDSPKRTLIKFFEKGKVNESALYVSSKKVSSKSNKMDEEGLNRYSVYKINIERLSF